jgi:Periplasmic binding protein
MRHFVKTKTIIILFLACELLFGLEGRAEEKSIPQENTLVLGRVANFSKNEESKQVRLGLESIFRSVNDKGGVNGKRIKVLEFDDAGTAKKSKEGVEVLKKKYNVLAIVAPTQSQLETQWEKWGSEVNTYVLGADLEKGSNHVMTLRPGQESRLEALAQYGKQAQWKDVEVWGSEYEVEHATKVMKKAGLSNAEGGFSERVLSFLTIDQTRARIKERASVAEVMSMRSPTEVKNHQHTHGWIFADALVSLDSKKEVVKEYRMGMRKYYEKESLTLVGLRAFLWGKVIADAMGRIRGEVTSESLWKSVLSTRALDLGGVVLSIDEKEGWSWVNLMMSDEKRDAWVD